MIISPSNGASVSSPFNLNGYSNSDEVTILTSAGSFRISVVNGFWTTQLSFSTGTETISVLDGTNTESIYITIKTNISVAPIIIEINTEDEYIDISGTAGNLVKLNYDAHVYEGIINKAGRGFINYVYTSPYSASLVSYSDLGKVSNESLVVIDRNDEYLLGYYSGLSIGSHKHISYTDMSFYNLIDNFNIDMSNIKNGYSYLSNRSNSIDIYNSFNEHVKYQLMSCDISKNLYEASNIVVYNTDGAITSFSGVDAIFTQETNNGIALSFPVPGVYPNHSTLRLWIKLLDGYINKLEAKNIVGSITTSYPFYGSIVSKKFAYMYKNTDYIMAELDVSEIVQSFYTPEVNFTTNILVKASVSDCRISVAIGTESGSLRPLLLVEES